MTNRIKRLLTGGLLAGLGLAFGSGCASDPYDVSYGAIKAEPAPELMTLNERPDDVWGHVAYTRDTNWRMYWEDWGRMWFYDHPSRLNPGLPGQVSGKPR